jgi:hypothetical protein
MKTVNVIAFPGLMALSPLGFAQSAFNARGDQILRLTARPASRTSLNWLAASTIVRPAHHPTKSRLMVMTSLSPAAPITTQSALRSQMIEE